MPPTFLPHPGSRFFPQSDSSGEQKDGDKNEAVGTGRGVDEKGVYRVWEDSINDVRETRMAAWFRTSTFFFSGVYACHGQQSLDINRVSLARAT